MTKRRLSSPRAVAGDPLKGLPHALTAMLTFWTVVLLWIATGWPPVGMMAVLMAVVVVGLETLVNHPIQQPGRRMALGALIGMLVTAPVYFLLLPRLDGAGELALVLVLFFWPVLYLFHTLAPPRNTVPLGLAIAAVIMFQLAPEQQFDAVSWLESALSMLTGFGLGIAMLGIVVGTTPRAMLHRRLTDLVAGLQRALTALADPRRADFAMLVRAHDQAVRSALLALAEVVPSAAAAAGSAAEQARINQLFDAVQTLAIRLRALQRARLDWRLRLTERDGAVGVAPTDPADGSRLGERWRAAFLATLAGFRRYLARPYPPLSLGALDALRDTLLPELERVAARRVGSAAVDASAYLLAVHGHYVGVARALREAAGAIDAIDWAAWRAARF